MKRAIVLLSLLVLAACVPPPAAPPPPPPPGVAAPPGARVFTVYFGWNRTWVGPAGMAILDQAAAAFRAGPVTVRVTGYADTSGKPGYNQRLSQRRAATVARILVSKGVPPQALVVSGRGENELAVPTPDGVREPHNRRVTVVE